MTHAQSELESIYRHRFSGLEKYRAEVWNTLAKHYFARWIKADSVVLDVGCGYCEFINSVVALRKYGMDLNPDSAVAADPDVTLLPQDCSLPWLLPESSLDAVFTSNFLEHLPDKKALAATLREAHRGLKRGGLFIAMGPNIRFLHGEYWDFIDHHIPLTDRSLSEALSTSGFRVVKVIPRFLPYTMSVGRRPPTWAVRLYLAVPLLWRLAGKQFLVVAEKREWSGAAAPIVN
jgi:SAM-dependent methyltransferase